MEAIKEAVKVFQIIKTPYNYFSLHRRQEDKLELRFNVHGVAYVSVWEGEREHEQYIKDLLKI